MAKGFGWIKLYRKVQDRKGYFDETFCKNMAWIDLLILANHEDNYFKVRGIRVDVKRGQVGYTSENLGKRWKWSRGKVLRFLHELEIDGQIAYNSVQQTVQQTVQQKKNVTTLISILNYNKYQSVGTTDGTLDGTETVQQTVHLTDINKKFKNIEEVKNLSFNWETEKKSFLVGGDWVFKFCTDKDVPIEKFDTSAAEFISDIELKGDYKDLKELRRHFTNWFNLKNKKNGHNVINSIDKSIGSVSRKKNDALRNY